MTEGIIDSYYSVGSENLLPGSGDIRLMRLCALYNDITGSIYSVYGSGSSLNISQVICSYLMKMRYLTADQFALLLPEFNKGTLAVVASRDSNMTSFIYDGRTKCYCLTNAGFSRTRSFFPARYLEKSRIPHESGKIPEEGLRYHNVSLRDVPVALLASDSFGFFDWYASVRLFEGMDPSESVAAGIKDDSVRKDSQEQREGLSNIADGLVVFSSGNSVIVEQDCDNENAVRLVEKFKSYGNYFSGIDCGGVQLLFNVSKPFSKGKKKAGASLSNICRNIDLLMDSQGLMTLKECDELLNRLIRRKTNKYLQYMAMKKLLDEYRLSEGDAAMYSDRKRLEGYVRSKAENSKTELRSSGELKRVNEVKDIIRRTFFGSNEYPELERAVDRGLSIVVTSEYNKYCMYATLGDSDFMEELADNLRAVYPGDTVVRTGINEEWCGVWRNCLVVYAGKTDSLRAVYVVSEISSDIAEERRMRKLFVTFRGNVLPVHFLFLVSSVDDAVTFSDNSGCVELFCKPEDLGRPNDDYNVTVRFMDYSEKVRGYFVPDEDGNAVQVRGL